MDKTAHVHTNNMYSISYCGRSRTASINAHNVMLLMMKKVVQYPNLGDCDAADDMVGLPRTTNFLIAFVCT